MSLLLINIIICVCYIGIAAGIVVKDESKLSSVTGILVSLAAGSFLYISMLEILPTELAKPRCVCTVFNFYFVWCVCGVYLRNTYACCVPYCD